ncbi:argonaute 5, partial [Cymbomonas tetramitiformis]
RMTGVIAPGLATGAGHRSCSGGHATRGVLQQGDAMAPHIGVAAEGMRHVACCSRVTPWLPQNGVAAEGMRHVACCSRVTPWLPTSALQRRACDDGDEGACWQELLKVKPHQRYKDLLSAEGMKVLNPTHGGDAMTALSVENHRRKSLEGLQLVSGGESSRGREHTLQMMREFGLEVDRKLVEVPARILPAPILQLSDPESTAHPNTVQPIEASWGNQSQGSIADVALRRMRVLGVLVLTGEYGTPHVIQNIEGLLEDMGRRGLVRNDVQLWRRLVEVVPGGGRDSVDPELVVRCLRRLKDKGDAYGCKLDTVMCVMPGERGSSANIAARAAILHTCDIELGLLTLLVRKSGFCPSDKGKGKGKDKGKRKGNAKGAEGLFTDKMYTRNLQIKWNTKLGGSHTLWDRHAAERHLAMPQELLGQPTIVMGGDSTRPTTGAGIAAIAGIFAPSCPSLARPLSQLVSRPNCHLSPLSTGYECLLPSGAQAAHESTGTFELLEMNAASALLPLPCCLVLSQPLHTPSIPPSTPHPRSLLASISPN